MAGGLVSLGPDLAAMTRQAAALIDKIIKGARPADIPSSSPRDTSCTSTEDARSLNLTIRRLLARTDEVIE